MKKIMRIICFLFVSVFGMLCFNQGSAEAAGLNIYNGKDSPVSGGVSGTCNDAYAYNYFCRSPKVYGTRISFIYYDGSSYKMLGHSLDIYDTQRNLSTVRHMSQYGNSKVTVPSSVNLSYFFNGDNYFYTVISGIPTSGSGEANYWRTKLLTEGKNADGSVKPGSLVDEFAKAATGHSLTDSSYWNLKTEEADPSGGGINKIGYRILIEPIRLFTGQNGAVYVMTPTEYASVVWNTEVHTTTSQVSYYLGETERMLTDFNDIGISTTTSCKTVKCSANDVQFSSKKGHAVNIIDISSLVKNVCNYETGEGFPVGKPEGAELTEEEKKCCDDKIKEIEQKYKAPNNSAIKCMLTCTTIPQYIACMNTYFQNLTLQESNILKEQEELKALREKYPACGLCDWDEISTIEQDYKYCIQGMSLATWMASFLSGQKTSCEINRSASIAQYKLNYPECPDEEIPDCPFSECPPTNNPVCDEDNPNHFPKEGDKNPDKTCCLYFENKMKLQYQIEAETMGLTGTALQNYVSEKIDEWFNEDGKEFRKNCLIQKCDINEATLTQECCNDLMEQYPEKPDSFWIGKGCKVAPEDKCKITDYEVDGLDKMEDGDCSKNTSLEANDSKNWDCIFESDNIKEGTNVEQFKDYYLKYSNPYCAVYCREDVKYNFPSGSMTVKAGNHFTVGNTGISPTWSPVQFTSTRECKTSGSTKNNDSKDINTEQFEKDWEKANDKVISTWDTWKIAQQQDWSYANSKRSASKNCDYRCVRWGTCRSCSGSGKNRTCHSYTCCKQTKPFGYTMYPAKVSYAPFGQGSRDVTPGTWCSTFGHSDPGSASKQQTHEQAKKDMETIETDILACTSWNKFDDYRYASFSHTNVKATRYSKYTNYTDFLNYKEFSPDLTIDYDEATNDAYDYKDLLEKNEQNTSVSSNFSTSGAKKTVKYQCTESAAPNKKTCKKVVTFVYSPQKETHATYTKKVDYKLKDNVFNVILKPQGTAVNGNEKGSDSEQVYIDLGYSALHVHFMTPSGRYDIGLSYPGFTPAENKSKFEHNFDQFIDDVQKYSCTYKVHNEIIENKDPNCEGDNCTSCGSVNCTPGTLKGLNLIYRPIALSNPFPGIYGTGRTPGSNWNSSSDISSYITNNRGVKEDRLYYDKYPMYQITLTPALIQKIRDYNDTTTYNDFNMDCLESNGRECKSQFLRGGLEGSYDFSSQFKTCKMAGNKGSTTCCGVGNWDDCDRKDGITRR